MENLRYLAVGLLSPIVGLIGLIRPQYAREIQAHSLILAGDTTDDENESDVFSGLERDQVHIGQDFRRAIDCCVSQSPQRHP